MFHRTWRLVLPTSFLLPFLPLLRYLMPKMISVNKTSGRQFKVRAELRPHCLVWCLSLTIWYLYWGLLKKNTRNFCGITVQILLILFLFQSRRRWNARRRRCAWRCPSRPPPRGCTSPAWGTIPILPAGRTRIPRESWPCWSSICGTSIDAASPGWSTNKRYDS